MKDNKINQNPVKYASNTPTEYKIKKFRQQIYQENYQKNKEKKKQQQKERYYRKKELIQTEQKESLSKYYQAEAIKVLISFKEYTELNQAKKKLWLDFNWTLQDCQKSFSEGYADIVFIMKLEQVAGRLTRDFWDTAKNEEKQKGKSWNILTDEEQQRLIRYWGYEKTRIENNYLTEEERLERQSQTYLKEIELAKFHEERGKIKCPCYSCEEKATIQKEVKAKIEKELENYEKKSTQKEQCPECGKWVKELDEESGICKKCVSQYE